MTQWFPAVDDTLGGIADNVEGGGNWILGGLGDVATAPFEATGDATGGLAGGALGGLGRWLLIAGGMVLAAVVAVRVI